MSETFDRCPKCQCTQFVKAGFNNGKQSYKCKGCNHYFSIKRRSVPLPPQSSYCCWHCWFAVMSQSVKAKWFWFSQPLAWLQYMQSGVLYMMMSSASMVCARAWMSAVLQLALGAQATSKNIEQKYKKLYSQAHISQQLSDMSNFNKRFSR